MTYLEDETPRPTDFWLYWPDLWTPSIHDEPVVTLGRPAGDGFYQRIELPWPLNQDV